MSDIGNFGEDSSDDDGPSKWRVYTETTDGEAGHVAVETNSKAKAKREALQYSDFEKVVRIEEFKSAKINHPFHSNF